MKAVGFIYNECMSNKKVDLIIAGQGAAGYSAALYSARYQVKTMILGSEFGGETAIGGLIENYPGIEVDGFDLMMSMKDQVLKYDVELFEEIISIKLPTIVLFDFERLSIKLSLTSLILQSFLFLRRLVSIVIKISLS